MKDARDLSMSGLPTDCNAGPKLTFAMARMLHRTFPKAAVGLNYDL